MDTYVCTIAGGKGGAGRTTVAINLGTVLEASGYDTVVVDADLEMPNVSEMLGVETEATLHGVLAGETTVEGALTETGGGLGVVPGDSSLEAYLQAAPEKLSAVIDTLRDSHEVVLVDTSASVGQATMEVLKHTDGTLLVSTTDAVALSDSERTAELSTRVGGNTLGVVLTRAREPVHVDEIRSGLDLPILGAIPLYEQEFIDEPVTVAAGSSPAAQAYRNVTSQFVPICVDGADPDELELIPDSEWLRTETRDEESARDNDGLLL